MNLIKHQRPDSDKIYLYVKDPSESKYQLLINRREKVGIENLKNAKAFIGYSQKVDDVFETLKDYNPTKKGGVLIMFDDVIADMESIKINSYSHRIVFKKKKLNISLVFI